jgi:CRP-like cAMP-binding protein
VSTRDIHDLLAGHPFFAGLDQDELAFVAGCGSTAHFAAGSYVAHEGDPADVFYVVRSGLVALEIAAPDRGPIVVDSVGEGEILGVSWLFPPYRWQFDARVVEPTRAVALDGACLRAKCDTDPRLGYKLTQQLAEVMRHRMQSARVRLLDLYGHARSG